MINFTIMNYRKFLAFVLMLCCFQRLKSQDPHFSQYFSSPLSLNPAYCGFFEGPQRLSMNFRNQWLGAGDPFTTATLSFEQRLIDQNKNPYDNWGLGIMAMYDRTANGSYNSNYLNVSTAYHKQLDEDGFQHLGIGFQGSIGSRRLDYSKIAFNEQFTSRGFDLTLNNGENFLNKSVNYFDGNLGILYNYHGPFKRFYAGASLYHFTQPSISFLGNTPYTLPMRVTLHTGASWLLGSHSEVYVSGQIMKQGTSSNKVVGMAYGHSLYSNDDAIVLYAGLWLRFNDAVYPYVGYKWENFQLGLSYDLNTSGIQATATRNKSFEISLIYDFLEKEDMKRFMPWY